MEPLNLDVESLIATRIGTNNRPPNRAQVYHPAAARARLNVRSPDGHGAALAGEGQEAIVIDVTHRIALDADLDGFHINPQDDRD